MVSTILDNMLVQIRVSELLGLNVGPVEGCLLAQSLPLRDTIARRDGLTYNSICTVVGPKRRQLSTWKLMFWAIASHFAFMPWILTIVGDIRRSTLSLAGRNCWIRRTMDSKIFQR